MGIFSFGSDFYTVPTPKKKYPFLNELTVGGENIDTEDDDYNIENEEESEPEVEPGTDENAAGDQGETEENTAAEDNPENDNNTVTEDNPDEADVEDDFSLPEDDGTEEGDDTNDEPTDDTTGEDTGTDETEENPEDTEFSMEDSDAGDAGGDDTGDGGNTGDDTTGNGSDTDNSTDSVDSGDNNQDGSDLKQSEDQIYDTLTDDQKKIRVLQLKLGFKDLYQEADAVLNAINGIDKNEDNMETIRRLINVLNNVKQYILDYMSTVFDTKTYIDNNAVYVKYINVFSTIRKTIDELGKEQKS